MHIFHAAKAEFKVNICQHSPNTEPKLIKDFQKLTIEKNTFQAMEVAKYIRYIIQKSPLTFLCHFNLQNTQDFNKNTKICNKKICNLKIRTLKT